MISSIIFSKSKTRHHVRQIWRTFILAISICFLVYVIYVSCVPLSDVYQDISIMRSPSLKTLFSYRLTPQEKRTFLDTFKAFDSALKSVNVTYFVIGGTLLGTYRHHGIIPWDDDADVVIPWSQSMEAFKALCKYDPNKFGVYAGLGISLSSIFFKNSDDVDVNFKFASKSFQWKFYPLSGSKVLLWPYRYPYIDIFFYEENSTHLITTSASFPEIYPKKIVFPLVERPFHDLSVPAPCKIEAFLKEISINSNVCLSRSFNHKIDIPLLSVATDIPCSLLADRIPFVNRTVVSHKSNGSKLFNVTKETLHLNGKILNEYFAPPFC